MKKKIPWITIILGAYCWIKFGTEKIIEAATNAIKGTPGKISGILLLICLALGIARIIVRASTKKYNTAQR